jgi:hypothetical protein
LLKREKRKEGARYEGRKIQENDREKRRKIKRAVKEWKEEKEV